MRQPRSSKKKAVVLSSDDDEASTTTPSSPDVTRRTRSKASSARAPPAAATTPASSQSAAASRPPRSSQSRAKPKPKEKTIYSFFNAATQRQREPEPVASQQSTADPVEQEDDIIQDDSLEEEPAPAATAQSKAALALRKRQRGAFSEHDGADVDPPPSGSQKFLKTSTGQRLPTPVHASASGSEVDQRPWVDKYGPVNLDELAVHKRKVADVRAWLTNVLDRRERKRLLVLKGAAGTAKTTTVRLLSKSVGFEINEWKNPLGSDFASEAFVSLSAQFEDFMGRSSKFGSLDFDVPQEKPAQKSPAEKVGKQVVLIEEFPNTFTRSSSALQSFRSAIEQYLFSSVPSLGAMLARSADNAPPPTPIVMIISETLLSTNTAAADSFTAHRLLGPEIMNHPGTTVIEFNPIAPTFLTKALELVVAKEARKSGRKTTPGPQVIKKLSEIGDVRSAISTLEFLCLRGDETADWGSRVTFKAPKKGSRDKPLTKMEQESMALVSQRESTLGIFHAVGKVVYNKREGASNDSTMPQPPNHLPEYRRPKASDVDVDALLDELGTDIQTFVAALHENYVLSCNSGNEEDTLDAINGCTDALSDADLLSPDRFSSVGVTRRAYQGSGTDSLRQDEMSFQTSVRGLLFSLPNPVKRSAAPPGVGGGKGPIKSRTDAHKMFYPTSARIWRLQEEIEGLLDVSVRRAQTNGLTRGGEASAQLPKPGTVESWSNRLSHLNDDSRRKATTSAADAGDTTPPLGSTGSLKREMVLERLPYTAMMLRKQGPSARLHDVEKITSFNGVGLGAEHGVADEEDDMLDEGAEVAQGQEWSTDRPTEHEPPGAPPSPAAARRRPAAMGTRRLAPAGTAGGTSRSRGATAAAATRADPVGEILIGAAAGSEKALADLVLSDDDIEDDD